MNTLALNESTKYSSFLNFLEALPKCAEIARHLSELPSLYKPIRYDKPTSSFHNPRHIAPCLAQIVNELYSAGNIQPMDRIKSVIELIPSRIVETLEALKRSNHSWNEKSRECAFHIANLLGSCSEDPQKMVEKFSSIEKMAQELYGNIKEAIAKEYSELECKQLQRTYSTRKKERNTNQIMEINRSIKEKEKEEEKSAKKVEMLNKRFNSMSEVKKIEKDIREMSEKIKIIERENARIDIDANEVEAEHEKTSKYLTRLRNINSCIDIWITEASRAKSVWISIKMCLETVNAKYFEEVLLGFQSRNVENRKYASNQLISIFESLDLIFIDLTIYDAVKKRFVDEKLKTFLLKTSTCSVLQESDEKLLTNLNLIENEVFDFASEIRKAASARHSDKMKTWRTFLYHI